jgi:hypothetical protein
VEVPYASCHSGSSNTPSITGAESIFTVRGFEVRCVNNLFGDWIILHMAF